VAVLDNEKEIRLRIMADVGRDKRRWLREYATQYFEIFDTIATSSKDDVAGRKEISVAGDDISLALTIRSRSVFF
jgi:hypothetical protein